MRPEQERASLRLVLAIARKAAWNPDDLALMDRLREEIRRHDAALRAPTTETPDNG